MRIAVCKYPVGRPASFEEFATKQRQLLGEAASRGVQVAVNRYRGGLANYLDVLIAEDELLNNWRVQTDVRTRAFILDVALIKALGGGYQTDPARDRIDEKNTEEFPR